MVRSSKRNIIYISSIIILFTLLISGTGAEEASDSSTLIGIDGDSTNLAPVSDVPDEVEDTQPRSSDTQSLDMEKQKLTISPISNNWPGTMLICIVFLALLLSLKIVISKRYPDLNMDIRAMKSKNKSESKSAPRELIRLRPVYVVKKVRVIIPEDKFPDDVKTVFSKSNIEAETSKNVVQAPRPVDSRPRSDMRFICINGRIRDRSDMAVNA